MDENTDQVEPMLVDMLKTFPHPVYQEKILSQIISYLMYKNNLIQALKYVPKLLSFKSIACVNSLQVNTNLSNYFQCCMKISLFFIKF